MNDVVKDIPKIVRRAYEGVDLDDPSIFEIIDIIQGLANSFDLSAVENDEEYGKQIKQFESTLETFAEITAVSIEGLRVGLDHLTIDPGQFLIQFGKSQIEVLDKADVELEAEDH